MNSVIVMVLKYLAGFVKLHPETWKARTTAMSIFGMVATIGAALATCIAGNDQNILHYVACFSPIVLFSLPIFIRDAQAKHNDKLAKALQTALDVFTKGTAAVLLFFFLFVPSKVHAVEIFNRPMNICFSRVIPQGYNMLDTAYWVIKPSITVPLLQLRESSDSTSKLDVSTMASAGGGITYERDVVINGQNYSTMSISIIEFLSTNPPGLNADFSAGLVMGMYNNLLQAGIGYDFGAVQNNHRWFLMLAFGINLVKN